MSEIEIGVAEIDRKYEVLGKMGEGGMGSIFKVRHRLLEEVRVIKMIRAQLKDQEQHQARFLREARMATQLRHPGIAQLYDFGVAEEGPAYMVMEFIDGTDLSEIVAAQGRLDQAEVLEIADQTLDILSYLHAQKLVHRDISPDNIMLVRDAEGRPVVKLIDLGIAKPLEASQQFTKTGMFVGKLKYASPEQLGGDERRSVEARSDIYSFGVVLYELLTGSFPIQGDSEAAILAGHLLHPPRSFDETDPGATVPPAVRSAVLKALAKDPEQRWASAEEFRRALPGAPERAAYRPAPAAAPAARSAPAKTARRAAETVARTVLSPKAASRTAPAGRRRLWLALGGAVLLVAAVAGVWRTGLAARLFAGGSSLEQPAGPAPTRPDRPPPREGAGALATLDFGTYHALVIGNDRYRQLPQLESAVLDAQELAKLLESRYGYKVRLLTDATRNEIITALTEVTESLSARDNLLLFYAGHGWLDDRGEAGYWQPVDAEPFNTANWISTRHEISAVLDRTPARQVLVVADSCYAGSLAEPMSPARLGPPPPGPQHLSHVRELLSRRARLALTSGGLSPVVDRGGGEHSIFSKALLEVLADNDRIVEVSRLFGELENRVTTSAARFGVEQSPELAPIAQAGDEGGEYFFVPAA